MDIRKAFDSVWHAGLIHRLRQMAFDEHIVKLIASFCHRRSFVVRINGTLSRPFDIPAGTPQGSTLSPILYNLYTADIPTPANVSVLTYADDTAIIATAKQHRAISTKLRNTMQKINRHLRKWHIDVNVNKTQLLFVPFDRKRRRLPTAPLNIDDIELEYAKHIKYLGVTFDSKLCFHPHTESLRARALIITRSLYPMIASNALSDQNRLLLAKQVLWPSITYAPAAWADAPLTDLIKLRRSYSRAAKCMLRLPRMHPSSDLYQNVLDQPLLEDFITTARQRMVERIIEQQNPNLLPLADAITNAWPN